MLDYIPLFKSPGLAGAVLQTAINSFIHSFAYPFPPNLQDILSPKRLELGS